MTSTAADQLHAAAKHYATARAAYMATLTDRARRPFEHSPESSAAMSVLITAEQYLHGCARAYAEPATEGVA